MGQRHGAKPALARVEAERHRRTQRTVKPVAVAQRDPSRSSGGSRGVHERGDRLSAHRRRLLERGTVQRTVHHAHRGVHARRPFRLAQPQVDRNGDRAQEHAAMQRGDELGPRRQREGHPIPGAYASLVKRARRGPRQPL